MISKEAMLCRHCYGDLSKARDIQTQPSEPAVKAIDEMSASDIEVSQTAVKFQPTPVHKPNITYFKDDSVSITSRHANFPEKTYSMAKVISVTLKEVEANRFAVSCLAIAIGSTWAVFEAIKDPIVGGMILFSFVAIAVFAAAKQRFRYCVWVRTESLEGEAISSKDKDYIERIVEAANKAIVENE